MCEVMLCVATVALGIDVGWRPLPSGGIEYIIQLEPEVLEALKSGEPIESAVLPEVENIRAYRITVGRGKLPRQLLASRQTALDRLPRPPLRPAIEPNKANVVLPPRSLQPPAGGSPYVPRTLPAGESGKPLAERQAAFIKPADPKPAAESPQTPAVAVEQEDPQRPWLPLILTLLGLFASLAGNVFLLWVAADFRNRYRALLVGGKDPAQRGGCEKHTPYL